MKKIKYSIFLVSLSFFFQLHAFDLNYAHTELKYTPSGVSIYSMKGSDFLKMGFTEQVNLIKNKKNGLEIKYILGQIGDILGTDENDYFFGFDNYRTNTLIGGTGDDFYGIQHTYTIKEEIDGGTDTYFTAGNTGPGKENVENLISTGPGGRIYGNAGDNLIITEGLGSEIHGGAGNDVMLVNGLKDNFFGEEGIDTIIFPGLLNDYLITGDDWGVTVKNTKTGGEYRLSHHDIEQYQFEDAFFGYEAGENTLSVGPNKAFRKVSDALHVAGNGDTIEVESGLYEDDFAIINRSVTIRGINGRAHFYAKSPTFKGKANFITMSANITFDNVEFSGNKASDKNGAGIRMEGAISGGTITVKNSYFHNNEVGILAGNESNGILNIENTEFGFNGNTSTTSHTVNVGVIKELTIKDSFFHNTLNGHNVRSLADSLSVSDSFFYDGKGNTSFNIEMAQGKTSVISGNTFVQTEMGENTHMIYNTASNSSTISNNLFVNNNVNGVSPINTKSSLPITLSNNKMYNYKSFVTGTVLGSESGNEILQSVNISIPTSKISVGNIAYTNPVIETVVKNDTSEFTSPATLQNYAGKTITVGNGKNYATIKEAVLNAFSGDKIYVDEGVYQSDYAVISNKNIAIIGLGKGAEFKKVAAIPNGKAIFVSNTSNVFFQNIIFSDADVPDLNGAGIRYEGGTLTIENCIFQNNENGILGGATDIGKGKIWINNSRFYNNGRNGTGYTHAIYIGEMDFFEIKNSTVSGTSVGHHVKSRARKNVIENNLLDDAGKDTSYNIDLPNGGEALVKGNTIIQSEASPNRTMLSYSAEKAVPNPGRLIIENNTFESFGSNSVGIKNHKTNEVILRNNTFKNVTTKYIGSNITEDNTNTSSVSVNISSVSPVLPVPTINTPIERIEDTPVVDNSPQPVEQITHSPVPKNTSSGIEKTEASLPTVKALPVSTKVVNFDERIDLSIKKLVLKNKTTPEKIDKVVLRLDSLIQKFEKKMKNQKTTGNEKRTYFILKMVKGKFEKYGKNKKQ